MKIRYTAVAAVVFAANTLTQAQTIVSTKTELRNVVLEDFTGIHCGYCPDAHRIAEDISKKYPGRLIIIGEHSGPLAIPNKGEPDFRNDYAQQLYSFSGVKTLPAGDVNRHLFPGATNETPYYPQNAPDNLALRRPGFEAACDYYLKSGNSPVNFGVDAKYDPASKELKVLVEMYFTGSATGKLNVAIMEHKITGFQSDYTNGGDNPNYEHNHVMRDFITGQWGVSVSSTTKFQTKNYTYKVPDGWDMKNATIAVFISKSDNKDIYSGDEFPVTVLTTGIEQNDTESFSLRVVPNPANVNSVITFNAARFNDVSISLHNMLGEKVGELAKGNFVKGWNNIPLGSLSSSQLPAGVYFLKVSAGGVEETKKIIVN